MVSERGSDLQLPTSLELKPIKYASGVIEEKAGTTLQDTMVMVTNGYNRKISSGTVAGKKGTFTVVQRLWRLEGAVGMPLSRWHFIAARPSIASCHLKLVDVSYRGFSAPCAL